MKSDREGRLIQFCLAGLIATIPAFILFIPAVWIAPRLEIDLGHDAELVGAFFIIWWIMQAVVFTYSEFGGRATGRRRAAAHASSHTHDTPPSGDGTPARRATPGDGRTPSGPARQHHKQGT